MKYLKPMTKQNCLPAEAFVPPANISQIIQLLQLLSFLSQIFAKTPA